MQFVAAREKRLLSKGLKKINLRAESLRIKKLEKRLKEFAKKLEVAKARWKKGWVAEFGMSLILRIGSATVILHYLTQVEQQ